MSDQTTEVRSAPYIAAMLVTRVVGAVGGGARSSTSRFVSLYEDAEKAINRAGGQMVVRDRELARQLHADATNFAGTELRFTEGEVARRGSEILMTDIHGAEYRYVALNGPKRGGLSPFERYRNMDMIAWMAEKFRVPGIGPVHLIDGVKGLGFVQPLAKMGAGSIGDSLTGTAAAATVKYLSGLDEKGPFRPHHRLYDRERFLSLIGPNRIAETLPHDMESTGSELAARMAAHWYPRDIIDLTTARFGDVRAGRWRESIG